MSRRILTAVGVFLCLVWAGEGLASPACWDDYNKVVEKLAQFDEKPVAAGVSGEKNSLVLFRTPSGSSWSLVSRQVLPNGKWLFCLMAVGKHWGQLEAGRPRKSRSPYLDVGRQAG